MTNRSRGLAVLAGAALVALALPQAPAQAATSWVSTATLAEPTAGLTDLGAAPADTPLTVTVALALHNRAGLESAIAAGQTLTPAGFTTTYAPSSSEATAVADYLTSAGFTGVQTAANRLQVTATGTVGSAESAFDTSIDAFSVDGRTAFANVSDAHVPASLGDTVGAVLGLNDLATMATPHRSPGTKAQPSSCVVTGVGYPCSYNPQGFWKAYDAAGAPTGGKTPVAIFAEGNLTPVLKDLRTEEAANGLTQVPVTVVRTGPSSSDTSGADEWDMDTQYSTGMAANVSRLYLYDATSLTDSDIAREFNAFAAQDVARAGSASFGECEYQAWLDGSMFANDEAFAEAAVQGQTVFASSGDTGGFCPVAPNNGVPAGVPDVDYPASSPYVVGVGGTTLVTNADGTWDQEVAWFAGGGGPSLFEYPPSWQDGVTPVSTVCGVQFLTACGRAVPDVAMDADPDSGANVYVDGSPEAIGGTSLSSPLALGVWARLESGHANGLGFAARRLYRAAGSAGYHDVTLGDTGPYPATPGYDLATGLGTFDVAKMEKAIG